MADLSIVAQKLAEDVKQWMFIKIGDATGPILPATEFVEDMDNRYSLKNTQPAVETSQDVHHRGRRR
jgi:hypothetical protein